MESDASLKATKDALDAICKDLKNVQSSEPDEPETRAMTLQYQGCER